MRTKDICRPVIKSTVYSMCVIYRKKEREREREIFLRQLDRGGVIKM